MLQAEDRAVEANKTVTRLQKDVDRIEGILRCRRWCRSVELVVGQEYKHRKDL